MPGFIIDEAEEEDDLLCHESDLEGGPNSSEMGSESTSSPFEDDEDDESYEDDDSDENEDEEDEDYEDDCDASDGGESSGEVKVHADDSGARADASIAPPEAREVSPCPGDVRKRKRVVVEETSDENSVEL